MSKGTVLITGGFGYVGSRLTPHLLALGYSVKVIDLCLYGEYGLDSLKKDSHYAEWKSRFALIKEDIRNPDAVFSAMSDIDTVIHLAAISNDPTGEVDEVLTRQVNFDAVGLLVSAAKQRGVKRFINASSSSVFGARDESNITEDLEPKPLTHYSRYKMLAEWIVRSAADDIFSTVSIRPATVCGYSPRQRFDLTVNKLTADALRKGVITVHGGNQRRPNISMVDMINLYAALITVDRKLINGRVFNFGFENHKVIDIAKLIKAELKDLPIEIKVTDVLDQRDYHISSEKIVRDLKYSPVSSIAKSVQELREHLEKKEEFKDIDANQYYNMKVMTLGRDSRPYNFLGSI
jgi:nucleoside-diphosphate-sugar epimerase